MAISYQRANFIFQALGVLTVGIAIGFGTAAAQSSEPKTVREFFVLVPERYMDGYDLRFRQEVLTGEHRGVVIDIANGYISYDASDNPTGFEFAIFRKSNGRYIVAFSDGMSDDFDAEIGNGYILYLLSYERGKWRDVTKALLPVAVNKKLAYMLPRHGRSIEVVGKRGKHYTLTWRNDRFHIKRAARS